ncbi:LacI family DNA-binding transcriptional regulator [Neptunicella marina]|uniref:LacI family DNA-binding transcriptional regulator n=1 Tax=Neptunicella marina TaxID=2125989 RepID=A0A8J6IT27_9ALTE|nr:LacI family DNA-binding transcriptional regulator [Neptunicella marina]MBC3765362.1 LacI family DNA-binding transcriptional regulator [Neptunicella marina]
MLKAGIKQVAKLSGVSPATVSRTLSNPEIVSAATREKVLKAIDECGYTPNRFGASLRTQKSGSIVVIIPDITNAFNAGIIRSIEDEAAKVGYSVLLGDTQRDPVKVRHYASMVRSGQVDGIILFSQHLPFDITPETTIDQLPPLVNSCEPLDLDGVCQVMVNNVAAAKEAVNHLISLGHKRIGAITGNMDTPSSNDRLTGYKQALAQAGIEFDANLVTNGNYLIESGKTATEQLLALSERPTALFCFSDNIAFGAMSALHDAGLKVPDDISVVGFDDTEYAAFMTPALTTMHQPLKEIGKNCMALLLAQIEKRPISQRCIELPIKLQVRRSTAQLQQ